MLAGTGALTAGRRVRLPLANAATPAPGHLALVVAALNLPLLDSLSVPLRVLQRSL